MPSEVLIDESTQLPPLSPGSIDHPDTKGRVKKLTGFWETLNKKGHDKVGTVLVNKRAAGSGTATSDESNLPKKTKFIIGKRTVVTSERMAVGLVQEDVQSSETDVNGSLLRIRVKSGSNIEELSEIVLMPEVLFERLLTLMSEEENEQKCKILNREKKSYLFSSNYLFQLLDLTPSVKTRIAMILIVAPRLTDPKSNSLKLLDMFRFSEDKQQIQEVVDVI